MKFYTTAKLRSFINHNIDEAEILSTYLDIPVTEIYKCINDKNYRVHNTLRDDSRPSLGFHYLTVRGKNKLYGRDFANPFYWGDVYFFVGVALGLHCNIPEDFVKICKHIINKFSNKQIRVVSNSSNKTASVTVKNEEKIVTSIDVEKRKLNKYDLAYWKIYGIREETLERENIYAVNKFWINNELQDYYYQDENPAYAYYLGVNIKPLWEVYRPLEAKHYKFRTNNFSDIKELYQVKPLHNLIITKSKKDKALISQILLDLGIIHTGILYTSESTRLKSHTRKLIEENYRNVYINFDVDMAGINSMKFFKTEYKYNMFPFIPENITGIDNYPKDISDFCRRFGYDNTLKLFNYLYNKYIL